MMGLSLPLHANKSAASSQFGEIAAWEEKLLSLKNVKRIDERSLNDFATMLASETDADSYLTSPTYYSFTGRYGLWVYEEEKTYIPFCWHPNIKGEILVFPMRGEQRFEILHSFIQKLPDPPNGVRLARVKKNSSHQPKETENAPSFPQVKFVPVTEQVLDWKYPVRILSTEKVARMEGSAFRYPRNHIKNIRNHLAEIRDIKDTPISSMQDFISSWSSSFTSNQNELLGLERLYNTLLSYAFNPILNVHGFVVLINKEICAITLWDESNVSPQTANRFMNLCSSKTYRGLADFVVHETSTILSKKGIPYLNVGGAETESLDQYKRKFQPAFSIDLHSIEVITETSVELSPRNLLWKIQDVQNQTAARHHR